MIFEQIKHMDPTVLCVINFNTAYRVFSNIKDDERFHFDFDFLIGRDSVACVATKNMFLQISHCRQYNFIIHCIFSNGNARLFEYDYKKKLCVDMRKTDGKPFSYGVLQNIIKRLYSVNIHSICKNKKYRECVNYKHLIKELVHEKYIS